MKKTIKLIGIIALIAVIGFSMAACGDKDDEEGEYTYIFINNSSRTITMNLPASYSFTPSTFVINQGETKTAVSTRKDHDYGDVWGVLYTDWSYGINSSQQGRTITFTNR